MKISLLCLDVDGVLTDGAMYYDRSGEALKRFHTRDAAGIALVRKQGIQVAWITAENSQISAARGRKLGIENCLLGCSDKLAAADKLRESLSLSWGEVAFMGDDWFDIPLLQHVGFSACPHDAHACVQQVAQFRSNFPGGNGAVRELCDHLISANSANANQSSTANPGVPAPSLTKSGVKN